MILLVLGFAEGVLQTRRLRIDDNRALRLPTVTSIAGGRLRVQVNNDGGLTILLGRDGKAKRKRRFPGSTFLRDEGESLHV